MKKSLLILLLFIGIKSFAQQLIYFDCAFENKVKKGCNYARVIEEETYWRLNFYDCSGRLIKTQGYSSYTDLNQDNLNGLEIIYNFDGSIYSQGNFMAGKKDGIWIANERDSIQTTSIYEMGNEITSIVLGKKMDTLTITNFKQIENKTVIFNLKQ